MNIRFTIFLLILFAPSEVFSQPASDEISTFIIVRHAEKADGTKNPDLSTEGYERSSLLAGMLAEIRFDAVYSTPYIRTTETVRTVSEQSRISINEYQPGKPEQFAADLKEIHRGEYVLIAGHSNTVPTIANALLGREEFKGDLDESEYDNILIVTITAGGGSNLLHLKY